MIQFTVPSKFQQFLPQKLLGHSIVLTGFSKASNVANGNIFQHSLWLHACTPGDCPSSPSLRQTVNPHDSGGEKSSIVQTAVETLQLCTFHMR